MKTGFLVSFFWSVCKAPRAMRTKKGENKEREEEEWGEEARDEYLPSCICFYSSLKSVVELPN